ncbi:MAG: tRNA pseudouridine(38-40) synthase TruA [Acidimicrobiia bacterium]|nr:tRNA pseudouridine(38-40) synthase TruA [Acidimicrobiia bacterium]
MRVRFLVAYDGSGFRGLAPNAGVRTVVGELQRCLEPLVGSTPDLVMSGRTDAGVHAWGQVLSADLPDGADLARIQRSLNARLAPEIVVRELTPAAPGFSARYDATGRRYRYLVLNRPVPDPFLARTSWWVSEPLDRLAMVAAAQPLVGEHDFSSFCRRPKSGRQPGPEGPVPTGEPELSLVRRVTAVRWTELEPGDLLRFEIEGSAFCHQMVRSIVGFLVAVGRGKRRPDETASVLAACDRGAAEQPAPPHGLTLWQVDY